MIEQGCNKKITCYIVYAQKAEIVNLYLESMCVL